MIDARTTPATGMIQSSKYDGTPHYQFPAQLAFIHAGLPALYTAPGTTIGSSKGDYSARYHSLGIFWPDRWYNMLVFWHADWRPLMHYVNIATPVHWDGHTMRYVDLDLDVFWQASDNTVQIDDEDEFAEHQLRYGYPVDLILQCQRTCDEVFALMQQHVPPFDGSLYQWRPDGIT